MTSGFFVAGLEVPLLVGQIAASERWTGYSRTPRLDPSHVARIFGESPNASWRFYTRDEIVGMTTDWHSEEDSDWFGSAPHDIDPKRSVLIGELGYDRPIALDYRVEEPCVRFMTVDARWVKVADSIGELRQFLGMDVSS